MKNPVGPVLRMSDDIEAIIRAIRDDNPDTEIQIVDRGAYVRVMADGRLVLTRQSVERHLGREFQMRQLEPMLSAFEGRITTTSDEIRWEYKRTL